MMLFRSACNNDLKAIHQLTEISGLGITTLPKDIGVLKSRLTLSTSSFSKKVHSPLDEYYLFVLEDVENSQVVGTAAIEAAVGLHAPFYSYKLSKRTAICHSLKRRYHYEVLGLVNDYQGNTELCTLFLDPNYRNHNNGPLLSRARFLFMANHPERFASTVFAEMRGVVDDHGQSPFWDQLGHHFFQMSFIEADRLTLSTDKQFIADLMPRNLVYVNLLAPTAQAVIGVPHPLSVKAMNILVREGFRYRRYVDIFDAGPTLDATFDQIESIRASRKMKIKHIIDDVVSEPYLISNTLVNIRATQGSLWVDEQSSSLTISQDLAELLEVQCGDFLRFLPFAKERHEKS